MEGFKIPICNSFQDKIFKDQLCYEVDLNRFSNKDNIHSELKLGFNFIMDYNEDRQIMFDIVSKTKELGIASSIVNSNMEKHALIYLNTIGMYIYSLFQIIEQHKSSILCVIYIICILQNHSFWLVRANLI